MAGGCASVLGEEEVDAYFVLEPDSEGNFFGWSEITVNGADPQEDDAILLQALLKAADGAKDLTFIQSIVAEAVTPEDRTPLAEGSEFPEGETLAPLELLHEGGIGQFFQPAEEEGDNKIRIEWKGKANPDHEFPEGGYRVNVVIKIEVQ